MSYLKTSLLGGNFLTSLPYFYIPGVSFQQFTAFNMVRPNTVSPLPQFACNTFRFVEKRIIAEKGNDGRI